MNHSTVWKIVKKFQETGNIFDRPGRGKKRSVRSPQLLKYTREKLRRNSCRSCRTLATVASVSKSTRHVYQVLRGGLGMKPFNMLHRQLTDKPGAYGQKGTKDAGKSFSGWPTARCQISCSRTRKNATLSRW